MIINVGSKNKNKILAVREIIQDYDFLKDAKVVGADVLSNVPEQPKSLEETVDGAKSRSKNAFQNCDYGIGIESGLMKVSGSKTGVMDITACAIFDGKKYHLGLSSAFEYPKKVVDEIFTHNLDASQAFKRVGLTKKEKIGAEEGIISVLTGGKIDRKQYTQQAIQMALIHLQNPELY